MEKTSYIKKISTGKILMSVGEQDETNPIHVQALANNLASVGGNPTDYETGFADASVVRGWLSEQDEAAKSYSDRRKESYPPATDYLDGVVKGDQAQIDKYIADCLAVKQRFPK